MKYTIMGFSQKIMVESGLNLNDASILRFVVDFYHTGKMKKIVLNGKEYIWISYKYVSESLPIIHSGLKSNSERTKKKRVADSIDRLAKAGVIEKIVNKDPQGTFVFVRIVEPTYEQYIARATEITVTGYQKDCNGVTEITVTKDKSINDESIKDSKNTPSKNDGDESFEKFWDMYGKKEDRKKCLAKWKKIPLKTRAIIFEKLPAYVLATPDRQYRKNPATYLNNECWNNEIIERTNNGKPQHNYTGKDDRPPILEERLPDFTKY